jgi:hypothetical protein
MFQPISEDQLYLTPRLSILAGAQAIFAERHFKDEFFTDEAGNQSNRQNFGDSTQGGRDLRNRSQDTGIHECQSQLAAAFAGQPGRF